MQWDAKGTPQGRYGAAMGRNGATHPLLLVGHLPLAMQHRAALRFAPPSQLPFGFGVKTLRVFWRGGGG